MAGPAPLNGLSLALLALLTERPMHPYEMHQLLIERQEDRIVKVRRGTLYHTVEKLAEWDLVREIATERNGNRPVHTIYEISDPGRIRLTSSLSEILGTPVNEYPVFPVALAEAHALPRPTVVELLARRTDLLQEELDRIDAGLAAAREQGIPRRFLIDVEYRQSLQRTELTWLHALRDDLEKGDLPWE